MTISLPLLAGILITGAGLGYALGRWGHSAPAAATPAAPETPAGRKQETPVKGVVPALMLADLKAVAAGAGTMKPNAALLSLVEEALRMEPESLRGARLTWLFYSMTPVDLEAMNAKFSALYSNEGRSLRAETALLREHLGRMEGIGSFKRWDRENNGWAQGRTLLAREVVAAQPALAERLLREAESFKFPAEIRKGIVSGLLAHDPAKALEFLASHAEAVQAETYAGELADQILNRRGAVAAAQWMNQAHEARLPLALLAGLAEGLRSRITTRMSAEAVVAFLSTAPGPHWPGVAEMIPAAELIAKRTGGKPADAVQLWSRFLQVWMKLDIDGPARWLQGRAGSPGYEAATAAFVREVKAVDPAAGKAWADTLKTPEFRKLAAE